MPNFSKLVDHAIAPGYEGLRPVIEKEILHYDILFALDRENLLKDLTFQGGTCLRLCYGSPRFSEDLDFVGGVDFTSRELADIRTCVMDHIGSRYGLDVAVKDPKTMREEPTYWGLKTDRWQVAVTTNPGRVDIPRQKIKLEVANVPAHTHALRTLDRNYEFLPPSYQDLLVPVETLDEILADKIVSLASCRHYIRHRDIWDLRWLTQKQAKLNPDLVQQKIEDYQAENYPEHLVETINDLDSIVQSKDFMDQMRRFIEPASRARTLDRAGFLEFLAQNVRETLEDAHAALSEEEPEPFEM
jgi:predicted nucleotidyltransferase component of viral defense system